VIHTGHPKGTLLQADTYLRYFYRSPCVPFTLCVPPCCCWNLHHPVLHSIQTPKPQDWSPSNMQSRCHRHATMVALPTNPLVNAYVASLLCVACSLTSDRCFSPAPVSSPATAAAVVCCCSCWCCWQKALWSGQCAAWHATEQYLQAVGVYTTMLQRQYRKSANVFIEVSTISLAGPKTRAACTD
jgi:hypothetical protein